MYKCRECKESHDDISEQEKDFLYNIRDLQQRRNFHAQEVGRLTPKGYSTYALPSHHGAYFDAKNRVSHYTDELAEILHPVIKVARNQGSAWATIRFRFKITASTLKALRQHKLFKDVH